MVELSDEAPIPVRTKPWTPKHRPTTHNTGLKDRSTEDYEDLLARPGPHEGTCDSTDLAMTSITNRIPTCGANSNALRPIVASGEISNPPGGSYHTMTEIEPITSNPCRNCSSYSSALDDGASWNPARSDIVTSVVHQIHSRLDRHTASGAEELALPSIPYAEGLILGTESLGLENEEHCSDQINFRGHLPRTVQS